MNATEAMKQASMTTNDYLVDAIRSIDTIYEEEGYAKKNPILVAAFIKTCAMDFNTWAKTEKNKHLLL